ncbi:MAG TPA: alanine racemase [Candidatus Limnocylindrales bacterium]|nr:alanine racemase [Candidatus Limnocylindrales bacterium]
MRPAVFLDGGTLRANAAAFAALGAPVAAVVKQDGYGAGARRLARELDGVVESYVVADLDELAALRPATRKPVRLLADAPPGLLHRVLDLGGIPNVATREALAEAAAESARRGGGVTVRVGILDAAGWSSIRPQDAAAFAAAAAQAGVEVELWTHVSSAARAGAILDAFVAARRAFEAAGVRVVSVDAAGTAAARRGLAFDRFRIGVGLFGARLGSTVDVACALRIVAPVVRCFARGEVGWAGYGDTAAQNRAVAVLRCGYGDGFPEGMRDGEDILSIGMQYTTRVMREDADVRVLVDGSHDLDTLAARAGISAHALVVGLAWT